MTTYIPPLPPGPLMDDGLEDAFQLMITGVTAIPPALCRPRWQPEPPDQPDFSQSWVAFGVVGSELDVYSWEQQNDPQTLQVEADEQLSLLFSFYGPNAQMNAGLLQMGLQVQRNRDDLTAVGIKLTEIGQPRQVPLLQKNTWVKRVDVPGTFRRRITRFYTLPNIEDATMGLDNEFYITPILVNPPA